MGDIYINGGKMKNFKKDLMVGALKIKKGSEGGTRDHTSVGNV